MVPQRVEELMKCYWPGSAGETRDFYIYNVLTIVNLQVPNEKRNRFTFNN